MVQDLECSRLIQGLELKSIKGPTSKINKMLVFGHFSVTHNFQAIAHFCAIIQDKPEILWKLFCIIHVHSTNCAGVT